MRKNCKVCDDTLDCNGNPIYATPQGSDCWFTPDPDTVKQVHPSNAEDVTGVKAVFFTDVHGTPIDVKVLLNDSLTPFPVPAGQAFGLSPSTKKITVDKAATMFIMVR